MYDLFLLILAFYTWRYAWGARDLKVVYRELGRTTRLARELEASKLEASKLEVERRSEFLNAVSHDLRTPLNGLTLRTSLAELQLAELQAARSQPGAALAASAGLSTTLAEIRESALGVASMLDVLLDYARVNREQPGAEVVTECFPASELCREIFRDIEITARHKGVSLVCQIPDGLILETDRLKLRRVLTNLVGNAVKFTPARGTVSLHADWRPRSSGLPHRLPRPPIPRSGDRVPDPERSPAGPVDPAEGVVVEPCSEGGGDGGGDVEIHVLDTGVGIPPEMLGRIFDEFYQVGNTQRDAARGFGMGLPLARKLVRCLGGEIEVHSAPGQGSRFTVVLPDAVARQLPRLAAE